MSDAEDEWKFNEYVKIGKTIQTMRGELRFQKAKYGMKLLDHLLESGYLFKHGNIELIETSAREYFLIRHLKAGLDENQFEISFSPKKSGLQSGLVCVVNDGNEKTRYYIKTHQYGPNENNSKSARSPDMKELFVYQLLNEIGIAPDVHFIIPSQLSKKTVYIATKECQLTLLYDLTAEMVNVKSVVKLDLISRILYLWDCSSNYLNCGQVDGNPMIVDFRIEKRFSNYVKSHLLNMVREGKEEFNYSGVIGEALEIPKEEKLTICRESLFQWNLLENIDKAMLKMEKLNEKLVLEDDDLKRYFRDVKETIKILFENMK